MSNGGWRFTTDNLTGKWYLTTDKSSMKYQWTQQTMYIPTFKFGFFLFGLVFYNPHTHKHNEKLALGA